MTRSGCAEQKVQNIDAVRGDVEQRAASGFGGIDQPTAAAGAVKPHVAGEFGKHRLADRAGFEQLFRALHLGIGAAIVGHAEGLATLFRCLQHGAGLGLVHRHRFFAEHMLARAERLDGLRRVQEHWRADVDGLHCGIGESFVERRPDARAVRSGLRGIARDEAVEAAAGFGLDGGNDATSRDVADSDDDPVEHCQ